MLRDGLGLAVAFSLDSQSRENRSWAVVTLSGAPFFYSSAQTFSETEGGASVEVAGAGSTLDAIVLLNTQGRKEDL
jgi:hypothetical protein